MKNQKWVKWAAGLFGVCAFSAFIGWLPHTEQAEGSTTAASMNQEQDSDAAIEHQWRHSQTGGSGGSFSGTEPGQSSSSQSGGDGMQSRAS